MIDREALVAALDPAVRDYGWLKVLEEAASERLAQLPEECDYEVPVGVKAGRDFVCPKCGGSGKVYPAGTAEGVARVLNEMVHEVLARGYVQLSDKARWTGAVLDALNVVAAVR